jgi:hypothetical protein
MNHRSFRAASSRSSVSLAESVAVTVFLASAVSTSAVDGLITKPSA